MSIDPSEHELEQLMRVEMIGEILVKTGLVQHEDLVALLDEQQRQPSKRLGELAVERGLIGRDDLVKCLRAQQREKQGIAAGIENISELSDDERVSRLLQPDRLGEILVQRRMITLGQLTWAMQEQVRQPERTLGGILLEAKMVTTVQLEMALTWQRQQMQALSDLQGLGD